MLELLRCLGAEFASQLMCEAFNQCDTDTFAVERLLDFAERLEMTELPREALRLSLDADAKHGYAAATMIRLTRMLIDREQVDEQRVAAQYAKFVLPEVLEGTQFEAMHLVNQSRLNAPKKANRVPAPRKRAASRRPAQNAAEILRTLGREEEGRELLSAAEKTAFEKTEGDAGRVVIELRQAWNPFRATFTDEIASFEQAHALLNNPDSVIRSLRSSLRSPFNATSIVQLAMDGANEVALPWEWVASEGQLCFRSAKALPRDVSSSVVRSLWLYVPAALRRALRLITPPCIVVLRPPVQAQERIGHGFEVVSRQSLPEIYRKHNAEVFEPTTMTFKAISDIFTDHPVQIVHIQAPVVKSRGQLAIDLQLDPSSSSEEGPTLLDADFWTQRFRSVRLDERPVLILDPPRPRSEVEVARQLMLRNQFAADLANKSQTRAILGTGLHQAAAAELAAERLALEIAGRPQLQQVLMLFRNGLPGDLFSRAGASLIANDPEALL